jgi:hypothetical protein
MGRNVMGKFISDDEMTQLEAPSQKKIFISDHEMAALDNGGSFKNKILNYELPFGTTPRGLIKGTAEALPTIGMASGGVVGMGAGPLGAVGGAGLGGAAGYALKNAIE